MNPAKLNDLVTLQRNDRVKTASGTYTDNWVNIESFYCSVETSGAVRDIQAGKVIYQYPVTVTVRPRLNLNTLGFNRGNFYEDMRLTHDGRVIKINSVINDRFKTIIEGSES